MLIFDEHTRPIILERITAPTVTEFFWVLDLEMMDYTLAPLQVLEEIVCPTITLDVDGFRFDLPTYWNMLIYDDETSQLDVIQLANAAGEDFHAVIHGPNCSSIRGHKTKVLDYKSSVTHVAPSLNKHQMLCHPICSDMWINISPADAFNKYLKSATIGDLL